MLKTVRIENNSNMLVVTNIVKLEIIAIMQVNTEVLHVTYVI